MSLNAREQQALDSIEDELAGSDPGLATMLSAFNRLTSAEEIPDREKIRAGSRRALRRFRRGRRCPGLRRACQRLGFQRTALLLLWLLTSGALIGVAVALSAGGKSRCMHGSGGNRLRQSGSRAQRGSPTRQATTGQKSEQQKAGIPQAGP